jgi:DHA2 family multidrug resistance protein-like MFS transporter
MTRRQIAGLFVLCLAVFMVAVDGTVVSVAVGSITEQLRPDYNQVLWIGDIYSFVLAGLLITMGNLGDRIGRKRLLLISSLAFGAASAAAAMAPTAGLLIAARAVQGLAGAGLMPSTLALLRSLFSDEGQRMRAVGLWSAAGAAGAALGPTVAGVLLEHFYWGSVLLVNLPVVALIVGMGAWVLTEARSEGEHPIDPLSVVYSTLGILGVVYGITELAHKGLGVRAAYVALVVGATLLWVFLRRQRRLPTPLLDLALFSQSRFTAAIVAQLVIVFANIGALFFLPIFLRQIGGFSPLQSGLATLPESIVGLLAASNAARLIRRWGHQRTLLTGLAAGTAGLILLGLALPLSYPAMVIPLMLLGFSFGTSMTVTSDLVLTSASADRVGAATGISETSFELGTALGIAITGSVVSLLYLVIVGSPANFSGNADARGFTLSMSANCVLAGILLGMVTLVISRTLRGQESGAATPSTDGTLTPPQPR